MQYQQQGTVRVILLIVCTFLTNGFEIAAADRLESVNPLKKVVYSGDAALEPQLIVTNLNNYVYHYAVIPIPELQLANMPQVSVWVYQLGDGDTPIPGWMQSDFSWLRNQLVVLTNNTCYLLWAYQFGVVFREFKVVVTYEDSAQDAGSFSMMSPTVRDNEITLEWNSNIGQQYGLESSSDSIGWTPMVSNLVATNRTMLFTTNVSSPSTFYRAFRQTP